MEVTEESKISDVHVKPLPYLRIFLLVFLAFNLIGIVNFPFYREKIENAELYLLVFLGIFGFVAGTFFIRSIRFKFAPPKGRLKRPLFNLMFVSTNLISFLLISYTHVINGGIIIMMGNARFTNYSITTLMVYVAIITTMLSFADHLLRNKKANVYFLSFILFQALTVLSLGYRSPLIILVVGSAILFIVVRNDYQNRFKNIFGFKNVVFFLLLVALMSAISSYRVSTTYNLQGFFRNIDFDYLEKHPYLKPYMSTFAVFRYDQEVVKKIILKTEDYPYYGKLAMSNFLTLLPGEQLGARNMVGELIDAHRQPDGKPWSITPTLQGALFMDFGYVGVVFGFILLAAVLEFLKMISRAKKDPFLLVIYALFAINSLMLVHTGYFDVTFFILLAFILIVRFILTRITILVTDKALTTGMANE